MRARLVVLATCIVLAAASTARCAVIHVRTDGSDDNDGLSWTNAKKTVQTGIDAASAGDEVWVAKGTYSVNILLKSGVGLYGGFSGDEETRDRRDVKFNVTVLDGDQCGSVVLIHSEVTPDTVIDGFTIQNGYSGWGRFCSADREIDSLLIVSMLAFADFSYGSGIYCGGSATISNNTIAGNQGFFGGGICCWGSPTITNNIITDNSGDTGGGICCGWDTAPFISGNTIKHNVASYGGGIFCEYGTSPTITNNTIVENTAGGISCQYSLASISNNIIAFNLPGIHSENSYLTLHSNDVYNPGGECYSGVAPGLGDISVDPLFASPIRGNLHIQADSPCRNTGWNDAPGIATTDIDGRPRRQDGIVDIGAHESDGTSWPVTTTVVRVRPDGDNASDGSSWLLAKKTVQSAVDAASSDGGEVWVKTGIYNEHVTLKPYVYLYGGFAGDEDSRSARGPGGGQSMLDGGGNGTVVDVQYSPYSQPCGIDRFTVCNGITGICGDGSVLITNSIVTGNSNSGIFCAWNSACTILNNTIILNGEGIGCNANASAAISNNIIAFNYSGISGHYDECSYPGYVAIHNNCVYNRGGKDYCGLSPGNGDVSVDPKLVSLPCGNFHIQPDSPCRDAGCDIHVIETTDLDGQPRVQGSRTDIGADESDGAVWPATSIIVRVSPTGDDANDGSTWSLAKKTVQAAINAASTCGGEVWVKTGIYGECTTLRPFVYLYGGFSGMEDTISARNWAANPTVLDGGAAGSVLTVPGSPGLQLNGIDGFTVRNGRAAEGGGIFCASGSSPIIINNTITTNTATQSGGGLFCQPSPYVAYGTKAPSPLVSGNKITGNSAANGGGAYCGDWSTPTLSLNVISGNTATSDGGALFCGWASSVSVSNNIITGNNAQSDGGGIYCHCYCKSEIANNVICKNTARHNGGGTHCYYSGPHVANNIIAFNSSGISCDNAWPWLHNNDVYNPSGKNYYNLTPGGSDISADPLFVNTNASDFHLTAVSPCINKGWDSAAGVGDLDMDGQPRRCGVIDIGADEYWAAMATIGNARLSGRLVPVDIDGAVVSAAFGDFFYIESETRACGIRVNKTGHDVSARMRIHIVGVMGTSSDGEQCVEASDVRCCEPPHHGGWIMPLAVTCSSLGGGTSGTQCGVYGWIVGIDGRRVWGPMAGLSNVGLLITTWGKFAKTSETTFTLDDSNGELVKCIAPDGLTLDPAWNYVTVTGVSSCEKVGDELRKLVRATSVTPG